MKIAWHMPTLRSHSCGLSLRAIEFAARLSARGDRVTFFVDSSKTDVSGDSIRGLPVIRLDLPFVRPLHWSLQAVSRRRKAVAAADRLDDGWDLVISCQPEFVAAYGRRQVRSPLLYVCGSTTLHHDAANTSVQRSLRFSQRLPFAIDRGCKRTNERRAFFMADAAVFDSDQTRELVIDAYDVPGEKCHTVRGGVDWERFTPATPESKVASRKPLGIRDDTLVVAWTGRMSPEKNLTLLIDAAARLRGDDILFLLVGDGPDRSALEDQSTALGLKSIVRFVGSCGDVRTHLRAADVFAFPSRSESFGCSLAEAMACGLPVVALRPDGDVIRNASIEVVEEGGCGLLANEPTATSFAAQIKRLCNDADLRLRLGSAARTWSQRYAWRTGAELLAELIHSLVLSRNQLNGTGCLDSRSVGPTEPVVV